VADAIKVEIGRRYRFSASHRLHNANLSDVANREIYGKCSNPYGHGHNYVLEVALSGPVEAETGMIANLVDLDAFVEKSVLADYDHKSFNEDVASMRGIVPTTENLCIDIFQRLKTFPLAKLERIRVEETGNNSFEYAGDDHEGSPL
jgi:6-pyruvoyltetrahydropterin/6-carboxytetrahydropterin synthase